MIGQRATDRQCLLRSPEADAYFDRSFLLVVGHRTIGRTRDQHRLEKIDDKIHHNVGNRTTSGSHKRSIVRSIVTGALLSLSSAPIVK